MQDSPSILSGLLPVLPIALGVLIAGYFMFRRARRVGVQSRPRRQRDLSGLLASYPHFVFAKIVEVIGPMDRAIKYEDPLDEVLESRGAGMVTGGGTQMRKEGGIEWVGIDIYLADLDSALEVTRQRLRELGAPPGSVLEYRVGEQKITVQIA